MAPRFRSGGCRPQPGHSATLLGETLCPRLYLPTALWRRRQGPGRPDKSPGEPSCDPSRGAKCRAACARVAGVGQRPLSPHPRQASANRMVNPTEIQFCAHATTWMDLRNTLHESSLGPSPVSTRVRLCVENDQNLWNTGTESILGRAQLTRWVTGEIEAQRSESKRHGRQPQSIS